ncbi:DUF1127 domain-containing protein [Tropicibacter oceani]|uniref:DUF1127 domain-containing protein n=1 Tax=Tropicibacter oceani TaxID=3058420 RepID=A0ABY8QJP9_9RHOB|nr:DUF1127 domain-containing protein [Tropicibacter oceani]WGW04850.1 DUF1127 domain-containing protein [Tropicibacter oceani]
MAHINAPYTAAPTTSPLAGLGSRILNALAAIAEANPRLREMERLNAKTDDQLAAMGLKRQDIARYVLRDTLYL